MKIRIDIEFEESGTVVRIAGRLTGTSIEQFRKACDPIKGDFVLDLSNLMFADAGGIKTIGEVCDAGAEVRNESPFIRLLLDDKFGEAPGNNYREIMILICWYQKFRQNNNNRSRPSLLLKKQEEQT